MTETKRIRQSIGGRRAAFTLVEVLMVMALLSLLSVLIAAAWSAFVRPAASVIARSRIAQEARLAQVALAQDLEGSLPASTGSRSNYRFVGRTQPGGNQLWLCFDGGTSPNGVADWAAPDIVIVYQLQGDRLVRWDQSAGTTYTVAQKLSGFQVTDLGGGRVQIQLSFSYRGVSKTYTLIARDAT